MRPTYYIAFGLAAAVHAALLLGTSGSREGEAIDDATETFDVVLEDLPKPPSVEPAEPSEAEGEAQDWIPEEFLAGGLAEPAPASLASHSISQIVRPEAPRPTLPTDSMIVGIPMAAQRRVSGGEVAATIFSIEDLDRKPSVRFSVEPRYPPLLKQDRISGAANVLLVVDETGRVISAEIETATHPGFGGASLDAARRFRFDPGVRDGKTVHYRVRVPFIFTPGDS